MRTGDGKNAFSKLHPLNKQCHYCYEKKKKKNDRGARTEVEHSYARRNKSRAL